MTDDTFRMMKEAEGSIFGSSNLAPVPSIPTELSFDGADLTPDQIPAPVGWRIIVAPISIDESTQGGIIITRTDQKMLEHIRFVGKVIAMGPLCFKHAKFKSHPNQPTPEPWCKVGDVITTGQYTGSQIPCRVDGREFTLRVINDDEIMTVIKDTGALNI